MPIEEKVRHVDNFRKKTHLSEHLVALQKLRLCLSHADAVLLKARDINNLSAKSPVTACQTFANRSSGRQRRGASSLAHLDVQLGCQKASAKAKASFFFPALQLIFCRQLQRSASNTCRRAPKMLHSP